SASVDILKAIAAGNGPKNHIFALGYSGWAPGQLEDEIKQNGWLVVDADPELVFGPELEEKWDQALAKIGIDPGKLSSQSGSA
ncbi:MAG: YqgE/AlgH family protein, partial [Rhodospirillales bacterium]